jgi:hypothetical protein
LLLMLRVKDGDIFNYKTLHKIQDITGEGNILPGVDHNQVFRSPPTASPSPARSRAR